MSSSSPARRVLPSSHTRNAITPEQGDGENGEWRCLSPAPSSTLRTGRNRNKNNSYKINATARLFNFLFNCVNRMTNQNKRPGFLVSPVNGRLTHSTSVMQGRDTSCANQKHRFIQTRSRKTSSFSNRWQCLNVKTICIVDLNDILHIASVTWMIQQIKMCSLESQQTCLSLLTLCPCLIKLCLCS